MSENDVDDFLETGKVPDLIKSVPEIKALVSLIKCQICYELMVNSLSKLFCYVKYDLEF